MVNWLIKILIISLLAKVQIIIHILLPNVTFFQKNFFLWGGVSRRFAPGQENRCWLRSKLYIIMYIGVLLFLVVNFFLKKCEKILVVQKMVVILHRFCAKNEAH